MSYLIRQLKMHAGERPDAPALGAADDPERITYAELDLLSDRVCQALFRRKIGRECMVMIFLPRGTSIPVCILGVMKAGAAFTVLEDPAPPARKEAIFRDAGCCLVIDKSLYEEMTAGETSASGALEDYAEPDPHDACYAVYTSGSTGTPKGVLHEYGQVETYLRSAPELRLSGNHDEMCVLASSFSFLAALSLFFSSLDAGACTLIADVKSLKDPAAFLLLLEKSRTTHTLLTPSYLKRLPKLPLSVKQIFLGGEPARDIYVEGIELINAYAASESGMDVAVFTIDRPYALTPVGKNRCGVKLHLLDENDRETDRGEICYENAFFRGYIGLPELNGKAFRNGLFHSGDEGYFTERGDLVVCGRIDEMIKIRGNRVEPGEVEAAIRKVLSVDTVVVKKICEEEREYLVAFCQKSGDPEKDSTGYLKKELQKLLPGYMIPPYYVFPERFPYLPGGKIDKKALSFSVKAPGKETEDAPADETERCLCRLFEKFLNLKKVGRNDDFFALGGDSLTAMRMIASCPLKEISVADLYELRTPAKISGRYRFRSISGEDAEKRRAEAMEHPQPALIEIQTVFDVQKYAPHSTMWNLSFLYEMREGTQPDRLREAIDRVLRHHPVFSSVFFYENGKLMQKYCPERFLATEIIHTTEAGFTEAVGKLVRPFEVLTDTLLYRRTIYVTEKRVLLFFDVHHSLTDGTSLKLLKDQVCACYEDPETVLPKDHYYRILEDFSREIETYRDAGNEVTRHYRALAERYLSDPEFLIPVLPDGVEESLHRGQVKAGTGLLKSEVRSFLKKNRLSENEFFCTVCLLAVDRYNGAKRSMLQFVHSGRDNALRAEACGLLLHSIPLFSDLSQYRSLQELFSDIRSQAEYGITHGNFNICSLIEETFDLSMFFIFQKDMLRSDPSGLFAGRIETDPPNAANSLMEISLIDNEEEESYRLEIAYSSTNYQEQSIRRFTDLFLNITKAMLREKDPESCRIDALFSVL